MFSGQARHGARNIMAGRLRRKPEKRNTEL
jgi:hypothetical protein